MAGQTKIYLDTSVINFLHAEDVPFWREKTLELFDRYIATGLYQTFVSNFVVEEIKRTKNEQRRNQLLSVIEDHRLAFLPVPNLDEVTNLASSYIQNKIIPPGKKTDALPIAVSVVNQIDYLVSWNFQHLAKVNRERRVLILNLQNNYLHPLRIITPLQLMDAAFL